MTREHECTPPAELHLIAGLLSDTGRIRERNEDACTVWISSNGNRTARKVMACLAVADGMGGHDAGEAASHLAVDAIRDAFAGPQALILENGDELLGWLDVLFQLINHKLVELARTQHLTRGTGCTLTVAVVFDRHLYLAHVGDSRCYRLRGAELTQLTRDHSWVAEQRRAGLLTLVQERNHPQRHLLIRCVGMDRPLEVDLATVPIESGDRFLLCSDGLHGLIEDAAIAEALAKEPHPQIAVERLVDLANAAGGSDNITAVLLDIWVAEASKGRMCEPAPAALPDGQPDAPLPLYGVRPRRRRVMMGGAAVVLGAFGMGLWWGSMAWKAPDRSGAATERTADSVLPAVPLHRLRSDTLSRPPLGSETSPALGEP